MASQVPDSLVRLAAAMKLFEIGRLSSGAAAELAGISRVEFLSRLSEFNVPAFNQTPDELDQELAVARRAAHCY